MGILHSLLITFNPISNPHGFMPYAFTLVVLLTAFWFRTQPDSLPDLNPRKRFEISNRRRVLDFIQNSKAILQKGREKFKNEPYSVMSEWGRMVVLSPECADELRSDPRMDFATPVADDSHAYIPGFEPFSSDHTINQVVTKYLTKALNKVTAPLSKEASSAIQESLTDNPEWHQIVPSTVFLQIVARMSTRVFLGERMCSNQRWIKASTEYTTMAFGLADKLRFVPRVLRPIVHWFMPSCQELRRKLAECRKALEPHVKWRRETAAEARGKDKEIVFDDAIEWFEKEYHEKYDAATKQVTLSVVAIHTTTDLLVQAMTDVAQHPELFEPLRQEVIQVLAAEGLKKTSLNNLKLMDSVLKESQRLKPSLLGSFRRKATADIRLKNGYTIKKGTRIVIDSSHMWSSDYYPDAEKYDGYRFLKKTNTVGEMKNNQLVSTSSSHMGFGHGLHACPGRFFAANEIKIALCHLLLKYDWKLPDGFDPKPITYGMTFMGDPTTKMLFRRRKHEIDLESLS